jgi:hypothetical protein
MIDEILGWIEALTPLSREAGLLTGTRGVITLTTEAKGL